MDGRGIERIQLLSQFNIPKIFDALKKHVAGSVNDIVIFDSNFDEHVAHVKQSLATCADKGTNLNLPNMRSPLQDIVYHRTVTILINPS